MSISVSGPPVHDDLITIIVVPSHFIVVVGLHVVAHHFLIITGALLKVLIILVKVILILLTHHLILQVIMRTASSLCDPRAWSVIVTGVSSSDVTDIAYVERLAAGELGAAPPASADTLPHPCHAAQGAIFSHVEIIY